jgi:hypothetical protein
MNCTAFSFMGLTELPVNCRDTALASSMLRMDNYLKKRLTFCLKLFGVWQYQEKY